MSPRCTASKNGHISDAAAMRCPVHGAKATRRQRRAAVRPERGEPKAPTKINYAEISNAWTADSPEEVESFADSETVMVRMSAAGNRFAPPHVLVALAKDEQVEVRRAVARNTTVTRETLFALSRDRSSRVRTAVAQSPRLPQELQVVLAGDRKEDVRAGLIERDDLTQEVLELLSGDVLKIRLRVVTSMSASGSLLTRLLNDETPMVAGMARSEIAKRMEKRLGVAADNVDAFNALVDDTWWDMTPESPEVVLATVLSPNA